MRKHFGLIYFWLLCAVVFACAATASAAKNREWQDAIVTNITSETNEGTVVVPIGGGLASAPLRRTFLYYWINTEQMRYGVVHPRGKQLDLTLHGKTKICIDGLTAYVLDDSGKEQKLKVIHKAIRETKKQ